MKKKSLIIIGFVFALGVSVLFYPIISTFISNATSTAAVQNYQKVVKEIDMNTKDAILTAAHNYNAKFTKKSKKEEYESLLNIEGIMGYLDIPSIKTYLPIYHGVSEEVLQKGVGHLPESSLPVGGDNTHAVLSAHCGLPNARLFTDLDQMKIGDCFFVHVLEETMAYKVEQIKIVLPEEFYVLDRATKEDYVTLLTCTPYGINSHRLLVRGIRIPDEPKMQVDTSEQSPEQSPEQASEQAHSTLYWRWIPALSLGVVLIFMQKCHTKYRK